MTTQVEVVLCMLPTEAGGLVKTQASGTQSLIFRFGWSADELSFGGFLDLEGNSDVAPGLGPVSAVLTLWADEAQSIHVGDAFTVRYPIRVVGYGFVRAVEQVAAQPES